MDRERVIGDRMYEKRVMFRLDERQFRVLESERNREQAFEMHCEKRAVFITHREIHFLVLQQLDTEDCLPTKS